MGQQLTIFNFFLLCYLIQLGLFKKSITKCFYFLAIFFYCLICGTNFWMFHTHKDHMIIFKERYKMACEIERYSNKQVHVFMIILLPLFMLEIYALTIFVQGKRFLKKYPEKVTRILRQEINYFPIFLLITYIPKIIKHSRRFFEKQESFLIFILDKCCLGLMGLFICFAFIWLRKGISFSKFFTNPQKVEEVTEKELAEFNYYN